MALMKRFHITDVFGSDKYTGNQLATFVDAGDMAEEEMQRIACEIHFSETTFVHAGGDEAGGWKVRIFTPEKEVDFAGHPVLGTAYVIQKTMMDQPAGEIFLHLKTGFIRVRFPGQDDGGMLWMQQNEPAFGPSVNHSHVTEVLSLTDDDMDTNWPVEEVSTGLPHMIVPVKKLDALKKVVLNMPAYVRFIQERRAKSILVFAPEGYEKNQTIAVRVFPAAYGIAEDPATGSGNGCLAAYLVRHRYFLRERIDILAGQGYEIGRPSVLALRAGETGNTIHVEVGGRVFYIAGGDWEIS